MSHPSSHNHKMSIMCESYLYLPLPLYLTMAMAQSVSQSVSQAHVAFERHQTYLSAFPQELSLSATPELKPKPRVQLQLELLKIPNQNLECPLAYTYPGGLLLFFVLATSLAFPFMHNGSNHAEQALRLTSYSLFSVSLAKTQTSSHTHSHTHTLVKPHTWPGQNPHHLLHLTPNNPIQRQQYAWRRTLKPVGARETNIEQAVRERER